MGEWAGSFYSLLSIHQRVGHGQIPACIIFLFSFEYSEAVALQDWQWAIRPFYSLLSIRVKIWLGKWAGKPATFYSLLSIPPGSVRISPARGICLSILF